MNFKLEKLPKSKVSLTISVDAEDLKEYVDQAIAEITKHVDVKGFRPGKAPKHLVVEHVGQNKINDEVLNNAIEGSYSKIVIDNNIDVVAHPKIEVVKFVPGQELEYKAEISVSPEVKLPDYKVIAEKAGKEDKQEVKVEEKELKDALDWLVNSRAQYTKAERPVQKGDLAVISYELRSDGAKVEGGDQKEQPIILGEGKMAQGFEDQIVGMKTGEEKEFSLDLPKDFRNKQIAGKKVDFKVTVNDVLQRDLPKLDDEFAKSLGQFEDLAALEKNIKEGMLNEKEGAEQERFRIALISKIAKESEMEVPDIMIEAELEKMIHELQHDVEHQGMEFDKYLEHIKKTREDLMDELREKAIERVKIALVMREIGKTEKVEVSAEELATREREVLEKLGGQSNNVDTERLHSYTENIITNEKVFELLDKCAR